MKKASPQTGRVEVTSLHGFIYENAAHCPVGRRNAKRLLDFSLMIATIILWYFDILSRFFVDFLQTTLWMQNMQN